MKFRFVWFKATNRFFITLQQIAVIRCEKQLRAVYSRKNRVCTRIFVLVHHAIEQGLESRFISLFVVLLYDILILFVGSGFVVYDTGSLGDPVNPVDVSFHVDHGGLVKSGNRDGHTIFSFHGNDVERT